MEKCENVWITLQLVWDHIIVCDGRNDFKIPHIGKAKLRHQGRLEMEIRPSYTAMLIASKRHPELVPLLTHYPEHLPNDSSNDDGGSETSNSLPQEVEGSMKMIDDNNLMEKEVVQEDPLSIDDTRGEEAGGKTLDDDAGANENDLQSLVEDSSDDDGYAADEEPDMPNKVLPMLK